MTRPYPTMQPGLLRRYLKLLNIRQRKPSVAALHELVQAHMCRVPYENISKLYYRKHIGQRTMPGLEPFLDGVEQHSFGGTCYANNFYFYQLLANLGYRATLCGSDMSIPDVHLVSIIDMEKRQYMLDVGYAAPFLTPLPRDLDTDHVVELGNDRYVLKPQDKKGRSRLEFYRNDKLKHGYVVNPAPKQIADFEQVIADSYRDEGTFINSILLARFDPNRSIVIHNLSVIESRGCESSAWTLSNRSELVQLISERFGIDPRFTRDAVGELGQLEDVWNPDPGSE